MNKEMNNAGVIHENGELKSRKVIDEDEDYDAMKDDMMDMEE